ncbi:arylamine N-acetyltransferase 1 [Penicillium macrosclerotiorum]|uniref:arylamine N-acetyltransferase 1 n=1 Tax=Penicillium macrosclerotiorum TaxID=303699 RepID=UPI002547966B|nr:arylamine N-acetyltransferase 1 [Penicillium macrosclerotiorum]KAJ5698097.1 arylamine N-acetyltransferase 1 [Penicillium macrosclerotiorum]
MTTPHSLLSAEQIDQYFERIQLPAQYRNNRPALTPQFLFALQAHHITAIPYENLSLHYAFDVQVDLNVSCIHTKLVQRRRGGYCMENNILAYHVLLFLGFEVYLTGARLFRKMESPLGGWSGWEHSVNLITLPDQSRYLFDVGYGGNGPRCPLTLSNGNVTPNLGSQCVRLVRDSLPGSRQQMWMYQFRNADDQDWISGYAFSEIEFFLRDFEVMNFFTSRSPGCFLTSKLLVVMFLRDEERIYGKIVLDHDQVKRNLGGKSEVIQICYTEDERVEALEKYFGLHILVEEKAAIKGKSSSLPIE